MTAKLAIKNAIQKPVLFGRIHRSQGIGQTCAIRNGDYKLVYWYKDGKKELYNLKKDIGETTDIAEANPKIVKRLSRDLGRYLRKVGGQRPSFKSTGKDCPWPDEIRE